MDNDMVAIQVSNMSFFSPDANRYFLSDINLSIESGETVVVSGQSGCGKSLLLKIISGLIKPTTGNVMIDGRSLITATDNEILKMNEDVGFVFQDGVLISNLNVYDNIALRLRYHTCMTEVEIENKIKPYFEQTGLLPFSRSFPATLTVSQKKITGLIRAVINAPRYLYVDELTNGIDLRYFDFIIRTVKNLKKEKATIVFITNDQKIISEIADRVLIVDDGRIKEANATPVIKR